MGNISVKLSRPYAMWCKCWYL